MVVVVVAPVGKRLVPAGARAGPVGGDASSVVPPSEVTRSTDKGGAESCSFLRKNRGMLNGRNRGISQKEETKVQYMK